MSPLPASASLCRPAPPRQPTLRPPEPGRPPPSATPSGQIGGTLGVAVMGSILISHSASGTADAYESGMRAALLTAGALLALAIAGLLLLTRTGGARTCAP